MNPYCLSRTVERHFVFGSKKGGCLWQRTTIPSPH